MTGSVEHVPHHALFASARSIPCTATTSIAPSPPAAQPTAARSTDRAELPQYSLRQILAIWAAAALPMGLLAWVVAPWLSDHLGGRDPFIEAP